MRKKGRPSKADVHNHINERVTNAKLQQIILRTMDLLSHNFTTKQIKNVLMGELGKSEGQIELYISKAMVEIKRDFNRDSETKRIEMEVSLRADLTTAYEQYNEATSPRDKNLWFKNIMEVKDRILRFAPVEEKDENQTINISFKVAKKDE